MEPASSPRRPRVPKELPAVVPAGEAGEDVLFAVDDSPVDDGPDLVKLRVSQVKNRPLALQRPPRSTAPSSVVGDRSQVFLSLLHRGLQVVVDESFERLAVAPN